AKINRELGRAWAFHRAEADRRPYTGLRQVRPIEAARARVEGIHKTRIASRKNTAARDRWLAVGMHTVRKSESPLQFQSCDISCGKASSLCRLESGIWDVHAPTVPRGPGERVPQI